MAEKNRQSRAPRFLIAAIVFTIISYAINMLGAFADMKYYLNPDYLPVWSKLMMPGPGPPPAEFIYYSLLFTFVIALLFVFVYIRIRPVFKSKSLAKNGIKYGFGVFLIGVIPGYLSLFLLINLPVGLIVSWTAQSLISYLIAGAAVAKIIK
jgi:hypothetical protein